MWKCVRWSRSRLNAAEKQRRRASILARLKVVTRVAGVASDIARHSAKSTFEATMSAAERRGSAAAQRDAARAEQLLLAKKTRFEALQQARVERQRPGLDTAAATAPRQDGGGGTGAQLTSGVYEEKSRSRPEPTRSRPAASPRAARAQAVQLLGSGSDVMAATRAGLAHATVVRDGGSAPRTLATSASAG